MFTKLSMAITIAVREGDGVTDPNGNFRLRLAIEAARTANMPKENIQRAIDRASGKQGDTVEEVTYEGFGPGGFSVIVDAITDNKQRTTPEVKNLFEKNGGSMGVPGAVSYQFNKTGQVIISKSSPGDTIDDIFLIAADSGAEDVEETETEVIVYTKPENLQAVQQSLQQAGYAISQAELIQKPTILTSIEDPEVARKALSFLDKLESMDDVQKVHANFDIPESVMHTIS